MKSTNIPLGLFAFLLFAGTGCAPESPSQGGGVGTLRLLITDKPFPVDLIARADVTITRIEARRVNGDPIAECATDTDCDDGLHCNGGEFCDSNGNCVFASTPCATGQVCDEDADSCGFCTANADCDDGLFCTGPEICGSNGLCGSSASPCAASENCFEDLGTCGLCVDDADCSDGLFCNGVESCGSNGRCVVGGPPCDVDQTCLEGDRTCASTVIDGDSNGRPFVVLSSTTQTFDLLTLQNGRTDLLVDATLVEGSYSQLRLFVNEGEIELVDGRVFPLRVPSGAQSGIKLNFDFDIVAGELTTLLLDVDLSRAFQPIPGGRIDDVDRIRNFKFAPSLAMRLINLLDSGSITGTVLDANTNGLADVLVSASRNGEEVTSTSSDIDGSYMLIGLPTGNYDLEFSKSGFVDASTTGIAVLAGQTTAVAPIVMQPE